MRNTPLLALVAAASLLAPVAAPAQTPVRITGTVDSLAGDTLALTQRNGEHVSVTLPADARITALADRRLSDIKPGDFVGSAAIKGTDGKLHAQEVHIFPEALRGTGEGHRPMDRPDQTMTNATVSEVEAAPKGRVLTLHYNGGTQEIDVGPDARIVTFIPGDRSLLKPGAAVVVTASRAADGGLVARNIQAEKDGVPPLTF